MLRASQVDNVNLKKKEKMVENDMNFFNHKR